eukprot:scaffold20224_cov53-Attheya_sp.AAC.5
MAIPSPTSQHSTVGMRILGNQCRSCQTTRKLSHQKHQENSRRVHVEHQQSSKNYKQTNSRRIQQRDFNGKHNSETTTTMDWKTRKITRIPTS